MDNLNQFNEWPVRKSLTQPILVMGTEKVLLILNVIICLAYVLATRFSWYAFFAFLLFAIVHGLCMMISKHDPRAVEVYKRSTRYKGYYPPAPGIERVYTRKFNTFPEGIKTR